MCEMLWPVHDPIMFDNWPASPFPFTLYINILYIYMLSMAKAQAHWSDVDMSALIEYLASQLPMVADGTGFKSTVWNEAAVKVNMLTKTKGCNKTGPSCKNKFASVRTYIYLPKKTDLFVSF